MTCNCDNKTANRYVSFQGMDCDGKARRLMAALDEQLALPGRNNAFWDYFAKKRAGGSGPKPDDLFLIHCHVNQIRELFELANDDVLLQLLDQVEEECC